jgi:hypothetical protein
MEDREKIIAYINDLKKEEHIRLFSMIKDKDIPYSKNINGIHVNLTKVSDADIKELLDFMILCKRNHEYDRQRLNEYENTKSLVEDSYVQKITKSNS